MASKIVTLVRHGQAENNVNQRYDIRDPYLTAEGEQQCLTLPGRFRAASHGVAPTLVATSPLKRTIQTTLLGFPGLVAVVALPQLQETSALPCDTGSDVAILRADPMLKRTVTATAAPAPIDFAECERHPDWTGKRGFWAPDPDVLVERARFVRHWLRQRPEEHIVCVLHGGFLPYLTGEWNGRGGFPGTGWANTEFRTYVWVGDTESLEETEESKKHRSHGKPLGDDGTEPVPEQSRLMRQIERMKFGELEVHLGVCSK